MLPVSCDLDRGPKRRFIFVAHSLDGQRAVLVIANVRATASDIGRMAYSRLTSSIRQCKPIQIEGAELEGSAGWK